MKGLRRRLGGVLLLLALGSCGGDDDGGGVTVLNGTLSEPPPGLCDGCSTAGVPLGVYALRGDGLPEAIPLSRPFVTGANGAYRFEDQGAELDGARNVVVIGTIGQPFCAGAEELANGRTNEKTFDVIAEVACQAAVDLTAGTALATGNGPDGCEVASNGDCVTGQTCWFTLDPSFIDREHIANLENAARLVAERVSSHDDVTRAACAAISCTFEGAGAASLECMNGFF